MKPLTDAMKIEVKPFPPRGETPAETYAAVIEYLIKGDGAEIGRKIGEQFGKNAGLLFEISATRSSTVRRIGIGLTQSVHAALGHQ